MTLSALYAIVPGDCTKKTKLEEGQILIYVENIDARNIFLPVLIS